MDAARVRQGLRLSLPIGDDLKQILQIAYRARRPALLEGPTGIGKSEIVKQTAAELGVGCVVLDLSLLEPPDLVGLPFREGGRTVYAPPDILPRDGAGLLLLEELNRAEYYMQNPALQLLTERKLHAYELPPGWSAVAAVNPENEEYQVKPLDPAMRTRFLRLIVSADRRHWLRWAEANGVHGAVLNLARQHDRLFDDVSPRTWTYVSDMLRVLEDRESGDETLLRRVLGGYLPPAWVETLVEIVQTWGEDQGLDPLELLEHYDRRPALQQALVGFRDHGQTDRLERVTLQTASVLEGPQLTAMVDDGRFRLAAFEKLLADLPGDHRETLQEALVENPSAAKAVGVKAEDFLKGFDASPLRKQVAAWAADPLRRHRVTAATAALRRYLDRTSDLNGLRNNRGAMLGLGAMLDAIGADLAAPLEETLRRHHLEPVRTAAKPKKPR